MSVPTQYNQTLSALVTKYTNSLAQKKIDSPRLSVEVLLAHTLGIPTADLRKNLIVSPETIISDELVKEFALLCNKRATGTPVAYVTGEKEFYGIPFYVSPATLIPRPDTETLVEKCLELMQIYEGQYKKEQYHFADFGSGSGCIAISLGLHLPQWQGTALDISSEALSIAQKNIQRHGVKNIRCVQASFHTPPLQKSSLDFVVSNPPYVSSTAYQEISYEVRNFEPVTALVPTASTLSTAVPSTDFFADGTEDIKSIITQAQRLLLPAGYFLCEIGYDQAEVVTSFFDTPHWEQVTLYKDLANHHRVVMAKRTDA